MELCTFLGVNFQNHSWLLVSQIWKPSENHWKQRPGGWKSFNGDGSVTPKPSKTHWKQWSEGSKTLNADGQGVAKPTKNEKPLMPKVLAKKTLLSHRSRKMTIAHLYTEEILHVSGRIVPMQCVGIWLTSKTFFIGSESLHEGLFEITMSYINCERAG